MMNDELTAFHSSFITHHSSFPSLPLQPRLAQGAGGGRGVVVLLDAVGGACAFGGGRAHEAQADVAERLFVGRRRGAVDVEVEEVAEVYARHLGGEALELF